jgi:hypothetical protein
MEDALKARIAEQLGDLVFFHFIPAPRRFSQRKALGRCLPPGSRSAVDPRWTLLCNADASAPPLQIIIEAVGTRLNGKVAQIV